jgi:23S rRNA (cytosine1962-C5)-methyltransferase
MTAASPTPAARPRLRLRVTRAAETAVRQGHPWIFADSVREQNREGAPGEIAAVYDRQDRLLALGLFDPGSPLRLRVLHTGRPVSIDADWWRHRLQDALQRRTGLFDDATTGWRVVHGENDGWPGLVLDRYGSTFVLKLYTAAWLPWLPALLPLFRETLVPERLVLRLSRNIQETASRDFQLADGQVLAGPALDGPVVFLETGLRFEADVVRGQKTGFFLDQRENRRRVGGLAAGRSVLNAFSFSGGFSLYAARGGAASVADLDISPHALDSAGRNFALNQSDPAVRRCPHDRVKADAFDWLEQTQRRFDLIVLDPPSLARREAERAGAIAAYARLAAGGIRCLRPGGLLVAASCSAHVTAEEFFAAVLRAARQSSRAFEELERTAHPPDHAATFPEAHYLKCVYARFRE